MQACYVSNHYRTTANYQKISFRRLIHQQCYQPENSHHLQTCVAVYSIDLFCRVRLVLEPQFSLAGPDDGSNDEFHRLSRPGSPLDPSSRGYDSNAYWRSDSGVGADSSEWASLALHYSTHSLYCTACSGCNITLNIFCNFYG